MQGSAICESCFLSKRHIRTTGVPVLMHIGGLQGEDFVFLDMGFNEQSRGEHLQAAASIAEHYRNE